MGVNLKTNYYSPLRYPGGKGKLSFYLQLIFNHNLLANGHYVEPYAGGASVALSMLFNEYASTIHINDYDYSVYALWKAITTNTDEFCELVDKTPVTVAIWKTQKEIQSNPRNYSMTKVGFSTFFLNRTNRSGILKAGIIGGVGQSGKWKIDARYNKTELIGRIQRIAKYKDRIKIYNLDAIELINSLTKKLPQKTLFYLDPPYYNKGKELYINFYQHDDHEEIADVVDSLKGKYWLVSYDNDPIISKLYTNYRQLTYNLKYHAGKPVVGTEIMIYSDNLLVPKISNPINKKEIKYYAHHGLYAQWQAKANKV